MLQSIRKLSPFANGVTGFRPFANGLTFQAVCKRPRPFVARLDTYDCFRFCVDLTSLFGGKTYNLINISKTIAFYGLLGIMIIPGLCVFFLERLTPHVILAHLAISHNLYILHHPMFLNLATMIYNIVSTFYYTSKKRKHGKH